MELTAKEQEKIAKLVDEQNEEGRAYEDYLETKETTRTIDKIKDELKVLKSEIQILRDELKVLKEPEIKENNNQQKNKKG